MSSVLFKCHFLTNKKQKTYMTNKKHRFFLSFLLFFLGIMYICKIYVYTKILAKSILSNLCTKIISLKLGGVEFQNLPSVFWFDSMKLILSVYVDDLTLAGEASKHDSFWKTLKQHISTWIRQLSSVVSLVEITGL